jgi:DNA-binding MarR family transcriptional regulator
MPARSPATVSIALPAGPDALADGDPRLSRSLLRGLALLARFGPETPERGIVELAGELALPASTAHRYALTLVEAGLLERVPGTRRYRLAGL